MQTNIHKQKTKYKIYEKNTYFLIRHNMLAEFNQLFQTSLKADDIHMIFILQKKLIF